MYLRPKYSLDKAKAFGYLTQKETEMLFRIALGFRAKIEAGDKTRPVFLNVGAGAGTSSLAMAEGCPEAKIYTVEMRADSPLGGLQNERNAFKGTGLRLPEQILGKSHDVAKTWKNVNIDLACIDDGHGRHEIVGDIIYWLPKVKIGGLMVFHDYGSRRWPEVKKAVDRLMKYQDWVSRADNMVCFMVKSRCVL